MSRIIHLRNKEFWIEMFCEQMEDILSSFCGPDAAGWFELPEEFIGDGSFLLTLLPGTLHDREAARQATGNLG